MEPIQFINSRNEEAYGIKIKVKHSLYPQNQIVKHIGYTQDDDSFYFEHFDGDGQSEEYVKHFIEEFHKILKSHQLPEECAGDLLFLTKEMWYSDSYSSYIYHKRRLAERANIIIQLLETVPYHLDDTITYDKLVELVSYYDKHALEEFEMGEQFNKDNYTPAELKVIKQGMWREMSVKVPLDNNKVLYLDRYACLNLIKLKLPFDGRTLTNYSICGVNAIINEILKYIKSESSEFFQKLYTLNTESISIEDIKTLKEINPKPNSIPWTPVTNKLVQEITKYLSDYNYKGMDRNSTPTLTINKKHFIMDFLILLGLKTQELRKAVYKEIQKDDNWDNYIDRRNDFNKRLYPKELNQGIDYEDAIKRALIDPKHKMNMVLNKGQLSTVFKNLNRARKSKNKRCT